MRANFARSKTRVWAFVERINKPTSNNQKKKKKVKADFTFYFTTNHSKEDSSKIQI